MIFLKIKEKFEAVVGVIRSSKSKKIRQYNGHKKNDEQRFTKQYIENIRLNNIKSIKTRCSGRASSSYSTSKIPETLTN